MIGIWKAGEQIKDKEVSAVKVVGLCVLPFSLPLLLPILLPLLLPILLPLPLPLPASPRLRS